MAKCAYCDTTILFGGRQHGEFRFCNAKCEANGADVVLASRVPDELVREQTRKVHEGDCPQCAGSGPVDVHTSHRVWSFLVMTQWSSRPAVSCGSCATKRALGDTAYSLVLGWWGFPWGILMTPVQVVRNVVSLVKRPTPGEPTKALERLVRLRIAHSAAQQAPAASQSRFS